MKFKPENKQCSHRAETKILNLSLQKVGEEEEGNSELQTGNDSDGQQLPTHNNGGHTHPHTEWTQ